MKTEDEIIANDLLYLDASISLTNMKKMLDEFRSTIKKLTKYVRIEYDVVEEENCMIVTIFVYYLHKKSRNASGTIKTFEILSNDIYVRYEVKAFMFDILTQTLQISGLYTTKANLYETLVKGIKEV